MRGVYLGPCLYDWKDLFWGEIGQREVMVRRKGKHVAFASHRLGSEKEAGQVLENRSALAVSWIQRVGIPVVFSSCLYSACSSLTAL